MAVAECRIVALEPAIEADFAVLAGNRHGVCGTHRHRVSDSSPVIVARAEALGHAHMFAWTLRVAGLGPSPPACGGRGRGPSRSEGRVRWAVSLLSISPTSPRPSPPPGAERGPWPRDVMCACPSAKAGAGAPVCCLDARLHGHDEYF